MIVPCNGGLYVRRDYATVRMMLLNMVSVTMVVVAMVTSFPDPTMCGTVVAFRKNVVRFIMV